MFSRRDFLRSSALVALAPTVPGFLAETARAVGPAPERRTLVVVQLDGGNDGINTVVPFADEGYAKYRRRLRLPRNELLRVNAEVGLHPAMRDAARLLEGRRLAVVQGVGYPNPNRSHFRSMAVWHTANPDLPREDERGNTSLGWIGRALDEGRAPADGSAGAVFVGGATMPVALRSRRSVSSGVTRLEDAVLELEGGARSVEGESEGGELEAFVRRSTLDAYASSELMARVLRAEDRGARYPATGLAGKLRVIARLIKGGAGTRVYYTAQGNNAYDTHYAQPQQHAELLSELCGALRAFLDDLAAARLADRVLVLCFSEFGRRVEENGSAGTDHGTAGPVFLAGPRVRAGLVGRTPRLLDLQDGDLRIGIDFRRVYATVLEDWLALPSNRPLGGDFAKLSLIQS
jgi:uncharacterized protein (DUF1501 family)